MNPPRIAIRCALAALVVSLCACSLIPTSGPMVRDVMPASGAPVNAAPVQIVDVDDAVARRLLVQLSKQMFSETLGDRPADALLVGKGDVLEVTIWEATPATLFGPGSGSASSARGGVTNSAGSRAVTLPEQMVNESGTITVPFAGSVAAKGRSLRQIEEDIVARLAGKAHQPQVLVRAIRSPSANVTVVGEVAASSRMPLTPRGERLLDALASAGGTRQPVHKTTIQITRGGAVHELPLDTIIRDPRQNVPLRPGDVVTALFQPLNFTALGATGKNDEVAFEAQGITLAQALARVGGLLDARSDPQGIFIFRFEPEGALDWPRKPVATTPDGLVPVIYRVNLKNPASFFVMQSFPMKNRDVMYVSNAPAAELQKFLNIVFSMTYPVINAIQVTR